jgi:hypothetical protein
MDVVLDLVGIAGPDTAPRSLQTLRPGGLYLGVAPGRTEQLTALAAAAGVRLAPEPLVEPDGHGLEHLARLVDDGVLRVTSTGSSRSIARPRPISTPRTAPTARPSCR